ncbi:MAG: VWA domain-containing protein [Bacteroidaceae bacterium]|nr:VWA domain-containing protein [Bacteroidaceae bacterium]
MHFTRFIYLLLFIPLIAYIVWYILRGRKISPSMKVSTTLPFNKELRTYKNYLIHLPLALRMLALTMLVLVLMRPVATNSWSEEQVEGIDIMLAMDVSTSMSAVDIQPNRIDVAKDVASQFVSGRKNDNIGLTLFAGESFTQCPLTIDYGSVLSLINKSGIEYAASGLLKDGTAIGLGIANAVSRLKDSKAKSKVIILLTDGSNNSGEITPEDAARIAKEYGIRIYTIGFRTDKEIVQTPYGMLDNSEFDEKTLRSIASVTGGEYFRSSSKESLVNIYREIDQLERTKLEIKHFGDQEEKFMIFALIAVVSLMLEILLRNTILKRIP